ncbi:MAG: DUF134 domain-containing protein [Patescibacteria group bacterium]
MPRPKLRRRLCIRPEVTYFKPRGIPLHALTTVNLSREELEVVWLIDDLGYDQNRAARHLHTSQSTIQRVLCSARNKVARALVAGKAIAIEPYD